MVVILDIIGSMILGGILLLTVIDANQIASENHSLYNGDMLVQEILIGNAQMLEGELRNMGYGVPENQRSIVMADTNRIGFLLDLGRDGSVDTVTYYVGLPAELTKTMNELDRFLYRKVNTTAAMKVGVVTLLKFRYITLNGEQMTTPVDTSRLSEAYTVEITMEVQNPYAISRDPGQVAAGERNALYSSSLWQQTRLASQNSRR